MRRKNNLDPFVRDFLAGETCYVIVSGLDLAEIMIPFTTLEFSFLDQSGGHYRESTKANRGKCNSIIEDHSEDLRYGKEKNLRKKVTREEKGYAVKGFRASQRKEKDSNWSTFRSKVRADCNLSGGSADDDGDGGGGMVKSFVRPRRRVRGGFTTYFGTFAFLTEREQNPERLDACS
uniref:Uncharacterized protein n=1 Tax=Vespula pensylvanica TaxID=30213 RepID=A0A834KFW9_VESPE|nr:hypothetical protein H0235_014778 [Vespula pensylvanica]